MFFSPWYHCSDVLHQCTSVVLFKRYIYRCAPVCAPVSLCDGACAEVDSDTEAVAGQGFKLGCISCKMRGEVEASAIVDWYFRAKGEIDFVHVSYLCVSVYKCVYQGERQSEKNKKLSQTLTNKCYLGSNSKALWTLWPLKYSTYNRKKIDCWLENVKLLIKILLTPQSFVKPLNTVNKCLTLTCCYLHRSITMMVRCLS